MKQVQKPKKPIIFYYVIALIVILLLNLLLFPRLLEPKEKEVDYGKLLQLTDIKEENIKTTISGTESYILITVKDIWGKTTTAKIAVPIKNKADEDADNAKK